jgi:hypothetical protein
MIEYLAGPYSHPHEHIRHQRYTTITAKAAQLMTEGRVIYSPITSMHFLAKDHSMPFEADFWLHHDLAILRRCGKLLVLQLEGWENSVGLKAEIEFANANGIPVEYIK